MKTILVDAVDCFVSSTGKINQEMYDALEMFDNPKVIVTNAPDEMIPVFGLDRVPYPVFSLKKNPAKTDSKYFEIFLREHSLEVQDVVYFEHLLEAVESAKSVGIETHLFDHKNNDVHAVRQFLRKVL